MWTRPAMRRERVRLWAAPAVVSIAAVGLLLVSEYVRGDHPGKGGRPLATVLTGDAEVPGPGHESAVGVAALWLNPGQEEVCFEITFEGIDPDNPEDQISAGHIHVGGPDVAGPIVVGLISDVVLVNEDGEGTVTGCVDADRDVIRDIIKNPEDYYVNLHSGVHPAGAMRGQLSK